MQTDNIVWGTIVQTPDGPRRVVGKLAVGPHTVVIKADQVQPLKDGEPLSKAAGDCIVWDS